MSTKLMLKYEQMRIPRIPPNARILGKAGKNTKLKFASFAQIRIVCIILSDFLKRQLTTHVILLILVFPFALQAQFTGGSGRGDVMIARTSIPLPIELLEFNALALNTEKVKLTWITATETNNDYFTLQRSKDAINWENIKQVKGAGNSTTAIYYEDADNAPYQGTSYYRLKQTDYDGAFSYSQIRAVMFNGIEIVNTYPVPANQYFNLVINTNADAEVWIKIYDTMGRLTLQQKEQLEKGINELRIYTKQLSNGNYLVHLQAPFLAHSDKVVLLPIKNID